MPSINQPVAAFTLIEVLVALAVMAVVVPVIYQGMHVASLAGEVAERKAIAARIGDRVLYENIRGRPPGPWAPPPARFGKSGAVSI